MKRNLDGVYFRIKNEETGEFNNFCFSDLTENQMNEVMENRDIGWLKRLCVILGQTIRQIGDQLDLVAE